MITGEVSELRLRLQYRKLENVMIRAGVADESSLVKRRHTVAYNADHCRDLCLTVYGEACGVFR